MVDNESAIFNSENRQMRNLSLTQGTFLNGIVFLVLATILSYVLVKHEYNKLDKYLNITIENLQKDIHFFVEKSLKEGTTETIKPFIDAKKNVHRLIDNICILKGEQTIYSSIDDYVENIVNIHGNNDTIETLFWKRDFLLTDIITPEKEGEYKVLLHLDKKFIEALYDETFWNVVAYISLFVFCFLPLQWIIFYNLVVRPIKKLKLSVENKRFDNLFYISDFNALNTAYKNAHEELAKHSAHLEALVNEEIDKRRSSEIMLLEQHKGAVITELMTNIAHHWRQPLNVIMLIITTLKENLKTTDEKEFNQTDMLLEECKKEIIQLSDTISSFSRFFKSNEKKGLIDIKTLLENLLNIYKVQTDANDIKIELIDNGGDIRTFDRPSEIKNIFANIFLNAKEAIQRAQKNGEKRDWGITVSIERVNEDFFSVTFSDNGEIIEPNLENRIFEPYFTTKFKAKGVGLGLFVAQTTCGQLGGKITYASDDAQKKYFSVYLPIKKVEESNL